LSEQQTSTVVNFGVRRRGARGALSKNDDGTSAGVPVEITTETTQSDLLYNGLGLLSYSDIATDVLAVDGAGATLLHHSTRVHTSNSGWNAAGQITDLTRITNEDAMTTTEKISGQVYDGSGNLMASNDSVEQYVPGRLDHTYQNNTLQTAYNNWARSLINRPSASISG